MPRITLRAKGQITLPDEIRRLAHLEEGDVMEAVVTDDGILLRPHRLTDLTQAWFWTPAWQQGERDAEADAVAGRGMIFESGEEFLRALEERIDDN